MYVSVLFSPQIHVLSSFGRICVNQLFSDWFSLRVCWLSIKQFSCDNLSFINYSENLDKKTDIFYICHSFALSPCFIFAPFALNWDPQCFPAFCYLLHKQVHTNNTQLPALWSLTLIALQLLSATHTCFLLELDSYITYHFSCTIYRLSVVQPCVILVVTFPVFPLCFFMLGLVTCFGFCSIPIVLSWLSAWIFTPVWTVILLWLAWTLRKQAYLK